MIGYLSGLLQAILDKHVIIDVNGVGYRVYIAQKNRGSISEVGQEIKIYTHFSMNPRDGNVELYGFLRPEELKFFELLTSISGIGPKSAQSILASSDLEQLQLGIMKGDDVYLSRVSGIGHKTAQRLIIELKSKILPGDIKGGIGKDLGAESEALEALVSLGYSQYQARDALKSVDNKIKTVEEKIKEALKVLGRNK